MAEKTNIPERNEIDNKYKWKLEDLYPDTKSWEESYEKIIAQSDKYTLARRTADGVVHSQVFKTRLDRTLAVLDQRLHAARLLAANRPRIVEDAHAYVDALDRSTGLRKCVGRLLGTKGRVAIHRTAHVVPCRCSLLVCCAR